MSREFTNTYLSVFCMEMHMLLQAGVALGEGALMLQDDEPDPDGRAVLQCLIDELERGEPLSSALRKAEAFPEYMAGMVETGEKTGRLAETLKALSEYYDMKERQAAAVKNAVFYPAILLVMMMSVALILIVYVLPVFNDVFAMLGTRMPPVAVNLMRFGGWLSGASAVITAALGALFAAGLALRFIPPLRKRAAKFFRDRLGNMGVFRSAASARFTAVMSLASASGLDEEEAVGMASSVSGNNLCADMLSSGKALHEAMREAGILSAREARLLALGTRSGMADSAMAEIARRKERAARDEADRLIGRIEPALVITASVIIGVILFSVMLPLMGIMSSIR